jgi:hypothetical protein
MPDIVSGILTAGCIIFGGYLLSRCIYVSTVKTTNDYYIITKEQLDEFKKKYNDTQPLILAPPEYSAPLTESKPSAPEQQI